MISLYVLEYVWMKCDVNEVKVWRCVSDVEVK